MVMRVLLFIGLVLLFSSCQKDKPADVVQQKENAVSQVNETRSAQDSNPRKEPPLVSSEEIKKKLEKIAQSKAILKVKPVQEEGKKNKKVEKPKPKVESKQKVKKKPTPKPKPKPKPKPEVGKITWVDEEFNFGFINHGDTVAHTFKFINTGKIPVEITNVIVGCGCTLPSYPLGEILPGMAGKIDITFLSENKVGSQQPSIDVYTTAEEEPKSLLFKGVVR